MIAQKCPACDGYGTRPRPAHEPGEGALLCRACGSAGIVWTDGEAPAAAPQVWPQPDPWASPYKPVGPLAIACPPPGCLSPCHGPVARAAGTGCAGCACPCCLGHCTHPTVGTVIFAAPWGAIGGP